MSEKKEKLSRRDFLKIVALSGAAGLGVKCGLDKLTTDQIVSETRQLMGTLINIKTVGLDPKAASAAIRMSFGPSSHIQSSSCAVITPGSAAISPNTIVNPKQTILFMISSPKKTPKTRA